MRKNILYIFLVMLFLFSSTTQNIDAQTHRRDSRTSVLQSQRIREKMKERTQKLKDILKPYNGPSNPDVDTSTMHKKMMCGYQGWFNAEGDGANRGWNHYHPENGGPFKPGSCSIDFWPDVSELDEYEKYDTPFRHADGSVAQVFSSYNRKTVLRHFKWMQEYGIDGAFVQRFGTILRGLKETVHHTTVLSHCREGANRYGRAYAVMYDLSGLRSREIDLIIEDWKILIDLMHITKDKAYLHHKGKPVISLWGVGFNDNRKYDFNDYQRLMNFFQNDPKYGGCAVIVGVPTFWRTFEWDSLKDPALHEIIKQGEIVKPWPVGRFDSLEGVFNTAKNVWARDVKWCKKYNKDLLLVVWPGFSWHNMYPDDKIDMVPRQKGKFFWKQYYEAIKLGVDMLYIGMFDEMDEGTAIFKCTDNPPIGKSKFLTYEGLPTDYYLWLAGMGGKMLRGEIPLTNELPKTPRDK